MTPADSILLPPNMDKNKISSTGDARNRVRTYFFGVINCPVWMCPTNDTSRRVLEFAMVKWLTIGQMKRNLADKSIWRRVLTNNLSIALFIAGFFLWPLTIVIYFATQVWKGRSLLFSFSGRAGRKSFWRSVRIASSWALVGSGLVVGVI
jgi:hypothetical protein